MQEIKTFVKHTAKIFEQICNINFFYLHLSGLALAPTHHTFNMPSTVVAFKETKRDISASNYGTSYSRKVENRSFLRDYWLSEVIC